jgi:hypothetical protein
VACPLGFEGAGKAIPIPGTCLSVRLVKKLTALSHKLLGSAIIKTNPIKMKTAPTDIALIMLSPGPLLSLLSNAGPSPIFPLLTFHIAFFMDITLFRPISSEYFK